MSAHVPNMMSFLAPPDGRTSSRGQKRSITFKVTDNERDMLDWAASAAGENRTEFLLRSARARAMNFLADQRRFRLEDDSWNAFAAALDDEESPNAEMLEFMSEPSPWHKS